ncbi:MAG: hypothetical protein IJZ47_10435 [Oscillospiraceae bacterium]|nr:hypothetical protein [Oscillospiraceae bacterium]
MNEQFWRNVTDGIDDKYTNEAAECFSKHSPTSLTESDFTEYTPSDEPERSKSGMWLGIGAAAAALVLCIGGAFFVRGDILLPADTVTVEATSESGESTEQAECIMISRFAERPLGENGRVEESYFEEPVPPELPIDAEELSYLTDEQKAALDSTVITPCFTLRGEDEWYFIYAHDVMTTSCTRYEVYRYTGDGEYMISVGEFSLNGEQLIFNTEPVLTEDYIIWYLYTEDEGFFMAMDINAYGMDNTFVLEFAPRALNAPASVPVVTGTNEITYTDDNGNMTILALDHDNGGELSVRDIVTDTVIITTFTTGDCHATDVDGKAVIRVKGAMGGLDRIATHCDVFRFNLTDYDGERVVWYRRNSDGTDTVFCQDIASGARYEYKLSGMKGSMAELLEGLLYLYDNEHILADLDGQICYKSSLNEVEESAEVVTDDEWERMKHYTGDEPEVLAFIDEISAGALEYQEQVQRNALENAEDESYREAAQQAIDEGGLDICTDWSLYVQTDDGGEYWVKWYRIKMALDAQYFEYYYRDESGFRLLYSLSDCGNLNDCCDGTALYISSAEGYIHRLQPDGSRETLLSVPDKVMAGTEEIALMGIVPRGSGERLTATACYGSYSEKAGQWLYREDIYVLENGELISTDSTGFGYGSMVDGTAIKYPYCTGDHGHEEVDLTNEDLLWLGQMRFNAAVMLHQIMHKVPEGDESDRYDENYIALDKRYFTTKHSMHDSISDLYDYTFAQDVYAYEDGEYVYFAAEDPEEAPWLDGSYHDDITLKEHIESRLRYHDGKTYALSDGSDESAAAWTDLVGVLDYEEGEYVDYLLCTACHDGMGGYIYEHSVMRLECFEGVWLITQIRAHLGNEYKRNFEGLLNKPQTSVDIIERDFLEPQGYTLISHTDHDLDLDGAEELLLLAGKGEERSIHVYEYIGNDAHYADEITDVRLNGLETIDAHLYVEGDRKGWFFVNGEPEDATLVMVEFVQEGEPDGGNIDGGRYVVGDVPYGTDDEYEHKCCNYDIFDPGMSGKIYYNDFDNDGTEEKMVHIGYSFYFFEEVHGYWIRQQELCDEWLEKAEIMPTSFDYHGVHTGFGMDYSDYDGGCWLYEYPVATDNCTAEITAAIKHDETEGYYIDYICSRGQYLELVNGMPDFRRYGWDESTDFERLTTNEYAALHSELFGYDDSAYTVPTGSRLQLALKIVGEDDVEVYAERMAADMLSDLCGYDGQRTFNMFQYKDVEVSLTPIAEADASRNVTAEERALGEAWIADISALVRYTGMMGDTGGFGWTDISAYNGLGWLIWKEGDTYCIRSRYLS